MVVTNTTNGTVNVDVEWLGFTGISFALRTLSVSALRQVIFVTNAAALNESPWVNDDSANLVGYIGYAHVNSDDPRIMVSAFQYCRSGLGFGPTVVAQTNIPAYPVGSTADFFVAGMPGMGTPLITPPESLLPEPS